MINKIVRFALWSERQWLLHQGIEEILTKIYHASKRYREKKIQHQGTIEASGLFGYIGRVGTRSAACILV
jgi:hypothetical protein